MHFGGVFKRNGLGKIRLKKILPFELRTDIYRPFIAPHFNYCSESWHHCGKRGSGKLEKINERALRFVTCDTDNVCTKSYYSIEY